MAQEKAKVYTVSQVNSLIKVVLEERLPALLTVTGQISDWKRHSSGHCYFFAHSPRKWVITRIITNSG